MIRGKIIADKTYAIKELIAKGPEIDILCDEFATKIAGLRKMLQNTNENVIGKGKAPAETSSPVLLVGISAEEIKNYLHPFKSDQSPRRRKCV